MAPTKNLQKCLHILSGHYNSWIKLLIYGNGKKGVQPIKNVNINLNLNKQENQWG